MNLNSNEPVFYPFSIKASKCSGSCNNINESYPYVNVKIFNLISRTNEARHMKWHETCKCDCKFDASVRNNRQRWNNGKC